MKTNLKIVRDGDPVPTPVLCRSIVEEYKKRKAVAPSDPPPVGSIRRVFWAASKDQSRGLVQRIKERLRFRGNTLDHF